VRILVDYRPALRERTGVGEYVHQVATALVETAPAGESLVLFSASWRDRLQPGIVPGASIVDRPVPVRLLNRLWHRLEWPPVEYFSGAVDVAQSAHPLLIPSTRAARLVTVHDLDFLDHPERSQGEIRRDYPQLTPGHVRRADRVIVVSEHTAAEVARRFEIPRDRMSICPPGVPPWPVREHEPVSGGSVLFLGSLEPRKNIGTLVDAYEHLLARTPNAPPLVLAGRITPEAEPIIRRTREAPLAGRVEVLGYVEPERRLELYRRALVFVLPSHAEGFGMPAAEAMMAGVPVIAANRGALPQTVGSAGRLVDHDNAELLSQAIAEVLANRALRDRMRAAGRRHAEQFTWTRTAVSLRAAWHLAVDEQARRRG
jgi:glycosyltransferase involved in cell wall biosynthesis